MAENASSTAKTPIETNSDLIAEVQSMVDNLPEAGGTDISLGVTGASVGDIVKVKAVDADGKPTEWEVAVLDSDKPWTKIIDVEITEPTASFEVTDLDNCTEFMIFWSKLENTASGESGYNIDINDMAVCSNVPVPIKIATKGLYGYTILKYNGMRWFTGKTSGNVSGGSYAIASNALLVPYNLTPDQGKAQKIKLSCSASTTYAASSGKLEVYAK